MTPFECIRTQRINKLVCGRAVVRYGQPARNGRGRIRLLEQLESRHMLAIDAAGVLAESTSQLDALNLEASSAETSIEVITTAEQTIYYQFPVDDLLEIRFLPEESDAPAQLLRTDADIRIEHAYGSGDDLFLVYTHRIVENSFPEANYEDGIDVLKGYVVAERRAYTLTDLSLWTNDNVFGNRVRFIDSDDGLVILHDELDGDLTHTRFYITDDGKTANSIGNETYTALFQNAVDRAVELESTVVFDGLQFDRGSGQQLEGIWTLHANNSLEPSDVTAFATQLVTEFETPIQQFEFSPRGPRELTEFNQLAYFVTDDGVSGLEVWRTDGTAANTRLLKDIHPTGSSNPSHLTVANERLFFFASDGDASAGVAAPQLWVSDGTETGTQTVGSPLLDASTVAATAELEGRLVLFTESNGSVRLWSADGTNGGTEVFAAFEGSLTVRPEVHEVGDQLLFLFDDETYGAEWWVTDGTKEGTRLAVDLNPGEATSSPQQAIVRGTELVFAANDGDGFDLWSIDLGTRQIEDAIPGDANNDLEVNFLDFLILSENFGRTVEDGIESGDFNDDGSVNFQDFLVISENFGQTKKAAVV